MTLTLLTHAGVRVLDGGLSANDRFKQNYPRYLRWALLVALLLTALGVWLMPRYEPAPYKPRAEEMILIDIPEPPVVPEKIKPQDAPVIPPVVEAAPNDDPEALETLPENRLIDIPIGPPILEVPAGEYDFVASGANPRLEVQPKADYPEIARRAGLEGTVVVNVLVGEDGRVAAAQVTHGVHPLLDRAALAAAKRCRFEPARQRQMKVKAWVAVPYRFRLR